MLSLKMFLYTTAAFTQTHKACQYEKAGYRGLRNGRYIVYSEHTCNMGSMVSGDGRGRCIVTELKYINCSQSVIKITRAIRCSRAGRVMKRHNNPPFSSSHDALDHLTQKANS